MKVDEAKLASELAGADVWPNVKAVVLDKKRPLLARIAALRGVPAGFLGSILDALAQAAVDKPIAKRIVAADKKVTKPLLHHGDLTFTGHVTVTSALFVTGDLIVKGVLADYDPQGYMAIGGEIHAEHMYTSGPVSCGNIFAKGLVYGEHNDHTLSSGTIDARVVISHQHDMQHAGVRSNLYLDVDEYWGGYGKGITKKLANHFVPAMWKRDEDEGVDVLDHGLVFWSLRKGKKVFLPQKRPAPKRRLRY